MLTLNEAMRQLQVGRPRLMNLLEALQIKPTQIHAKRRVITAEQFQKIKQYLQGTEDSPPRSSESTNRSSESTNRSSESTNSSSEVQPVVNVLEQQIAYLKQEVEGHKQEKKDILEQMQQQMQHSQQLMVAMQTETMRLRQENQQLLLEHRPPLQTAEQSKDIKNTIEEVDPVTAETKTRSSRMGWFALTIAMITALGWFVLQQAPDVQMRLSELVQ